MTVSVPANILLAGEYSVTMPGGLGLYLGIEPELIGRFVRSKDWELEGRAGERRYPGTTGIFAAFRQIRTGTPLSGYIDSGDFYSSDGQKRGFGSSAASAVALSAGALAVGGEGSRREVYELALGVHRLFQGGGSGYDVAASTYGGAGLLVGGDRPEVQPLSLNWCGLGQLIRPGGVVKTPGAVRQFYTRLSDGERLRYRDASNEAVRAVAASESWRDAHDHLLRLRDLGLDLGERLGVPASLESVPGGWFVKALGAGNEVAFAIPEIDVSSTGLGAFPGSWERWPIRLHGGVTWQE